VRKFTLVVLFVSLLIVATPAGATSSPWVRPVSGPVVRPFEPPRSRFGPGHRGVDFAAASGTPVCAAGRGVVTYAGVIAGAGYVVVAHVGGLRTSYAYLSSIAVGRGETVAAGAIVGRTGGRGAQHDGTVLHLGLRAGDRYLDPMTLFGAPDLTSFVHLAPVDGPRQQPGRSPRIGQNPLTVRAGLPLQCPTASGGSPGQRTQVIARP
jgi:murein DD-endopeptidase MepM/ murein hydrolase activator NlpD